MLVVEYLMRRRLSEALNPVLNSDRKIIDIAMNYQFQTAEGFSRAFKRLFGANPSEIRKSDEYPKHRHLPALNRGLIEHILHQGGLKAETIEINETTIFGLMTPISNGVLSALEIIDSIEMDNPIICSWNDPYNKEGRYLVAGIEESVKILPSHFISKTIPGGIFTQFSHSGPLFSLPLSLHWILHIWAGKQNQQTNFPSVVLKIHSDNNIQILIPSSNL